MTENNNENTVAALQIEVRIMRQTMDRLTTAVEKLAAIEERLKRVDDLEPRVRAVEVVCAQNTDVRKDLETVKNLVYKALGVVAVLQFVGLPTVAYLVLHAAR